VNPHPGNRWKSRCESICFFVILMAVGKYLQEKMITVALGKYLQENNNSYGRRQYPQAKNDSLWNRIMVLRERC